MIDFDNLSNPYLFGEARITKPQCVRDMLLIGGLTSERMYMIIEKVKRNRKPSFNGSARRSKR